MCGYCHPMQKIVVKSPAKVNLALDILGKDPRSPYHLIQTVYHEIPFWDEVIIEEIQEEKRFNFPKHPIQIRWLPIWANLVQQNMGAAIILNPNEYLLDRHAFVEPLEKDNLAYKAAELLFDELHFQKRIKITIKKNIPLRSGLGGGSSNAAAVLKGLNILYNLGLDHDRLRLFGEKLGMDVPFFIEGGTALGTHFGEKIEKLPHPDIKIRLYHTGIEADTGNMYQNIDVGNCGTQVKKTQKLAELLRGASNEVENSIFLHIHNDFEQHLVKKHSEIVDIYEILRKKGLKCACVTGSGGMVFSVITSKDA